LTGVLLRVQSFFSGSFGRTGLRAHRLC